MKKLSFLQLGFTFAGCFLGAGYVSGQELWQFFGTFGRAGLAGAVLAIVLLTGFGILLLRLSAMTGIRDMDRIVVEKDLPWLRTMFGLLEVFFLLGVTVVMAAGADAVVTLLSPLPAGTGSALLLLAACLCALAGLQGMIRVFSLCVPMLVLCAVGVSAFALSRTGIRIPDGGEAATPLLASWPVSAGVFVSYNIFASIGILTPLGPRAKDRRTITAGVILGGVLLLLIAAAILLAMLASPACLSAQLPMLALAGEQSTVLSWVYAVLLLLAMFGASLSSIVAAEEYTRLKLPQLSRFRLPLLLGTAVLCWLLSRCGFGTLIGVIFPITGYLGFAGLVGVLLHYIKTVKKRSKGK